MFDRETEEKLEILADEMYEGLVEDEALRYWEGGIVRSVPAGAPPEYITVEIEGIYDENVMWRGVPGNPGVGDEVLVWENPITHRREIAGASGTYATSPFVHDHSSLAQGGQDLHDIQEFEVAASTELTIAAGVITRTQVYHRVDTQADAATDDLDTVNGGVVGDLLVIRPENAARTVVVKHGTGNIALRGGADVYLDDATDHIILIYDGADWCDTGGQATNPWQKVTVAVAGGDFALLSAAIAWINALPGAIGPAATRQFAVNMMGGTFTEAADVTVPQWVGVEGEGEETVLDMGDFRLILSDDTSLENMVVTSTGDDSGMVLEIVGDDVVMRDVRVIATGAGNPVCVEVDTAAGVELYHVTSEATAANCFGFYVHGVATVLMWDCCADDTTNFLDAILIGDSSTVSTVTTRFCTFRGWATGDDVDVRANSVWQHFCCNFDPANIRVNVAATETPLTHGKTNFDDVVTFEDGVVFDTAVAGMATEGAMWPDSTQKAFQAYVDGVEQTLSTALFTQTADGTVTGTTGETTLVAAGVGTLTLPANFLVPGKTLRVWVRGINSTTPAAGNLTFRVKLNAVTVCATPANPATNNLVNRGWGLNADVTCRTTGVAGTVRAQGKVYRSTGAAASNHWMMATVADTVVDTTIAQTVSVTVQMTVAGNSMTATNLTLEVLN